MKNVLNYFVRKAFGFRATATAEDKTLFGHLLRIRQNIQGVYDWLYPKLCGSADGTILKRMPMTEAVIDPQDGHEVRVAKAWNSDTLLAHLRLLDNRKISNGYQDGTPADDGLPDGVSLARLLFDSTLQPTELVDDNIGWVMDKKYTKIFDLDEIVIGCEELHFKQGMVFSNVGIKKISFPNCKKIDGRYGITYNGFMYENNGIPVELDFPVLEVIDQTNGGAEHCFFKKTSNPITFKDGVLCFPKVREMIGLQYFFNNHDGDPVKFLLPELVSFTGDWGVGTGISKMELFYAPKLVSFPNNRPLNHHSYTHNNNRDLYHNLIDVWIGEVDHDIDLVMWGASEVIKDPEKIVTLNSNIREHIADRIKDRTGQSALTITFMDVVFATFEPETIAAFTNKNWTVAEHTF